jgi:NADPH:quinone reductase-like Zn-dependent oxidoreductase
MARSIFVTKKGKPDVLQVRSVDDPVARDGEVVVDVKSSGINFADIAARMGIYPAAPRPPFIPGLEAAGVVRRSNGGEFSPGDRVVGFRMFGAQSDTVAFEKDYLFRIADEMSFEEAAALPLNYLSAYHAVLNLANLQSGQVVLIHSAAGGVGTAACQLALHQRATVVAVAGGREKSDYLRELGIERTIDRRKVDFAAEIKKDFPGGVDVILDPVGGRTFKKNIRLLAPGGRIVAYGVADMMSYGKTNIFKLIKAVMTFPKINVLNMMRHNFGVLGFDLAGMEKKKELLTSTFRHVLDDYAGGVVKPRVTRIYRPEEVAEAHRFLQSGKSFGKLIINWN